MAHRFMLINVDIPMDSSDFVIVMLIYQRVSLYDDPFCEESESGLEYLLVLEYHAMNIPGRSRYTFLCSLTKRHQFLLQIL